MATRKPTFDELLQQSREQSFYNSLPKDKSFDELLAEYGNQTLDNDYYNKAISGLSNAYTTDAWNVSAMGRRFSLGAYVNPLDYWKQRGQAGVNAKTLQSRERELSLRGFDTAGLAEAGASYDEMLKAYVGMDVGRYRQFKDAGDYYRSLIGAGRQAETPEQPETPAGPYNRDYFDSQNQQEQMEALDEYMMRNQTETPPAAPVPGSRVPAEPDRSLRLAWGGATDVYFGPTDFSTEEQKADERAEEVRARRLQAQDDMVEPLAAYYQALQQDRTIGDRVWQQAVLHPDLRGMPRPQPAGSALPKPKTSAGMDWVLGKRDLQKKLDDTARKGGQWGQGWYNLVEMDDATVEQTLQTESAKVAAGAGNKPLVANIKEYYTWNRAAGGKARLLEIEQELAQIDEEKRRFTELAPGKFGNTAADDADDAFIRVEVLQTKMLDPYLTDEQRQATQAELDAALDDYLNFNNQYAEFDNRRQALIQEQNVLQAVTSGNSRNEEGAELRANDPDFNARAMYKTDNNFDSLVSNGNIKDTEALDAAYIYQYLSGRGFNPVNVPDAVMETTSYIDLLDASQVRVNPESYGLDYLTQYERQTFEYKYNTQGQQSAMDWLDGMSEILMYRRAVQSQENWAEFTKSSGWAAAGATALTVPANIYKAVMAPFRAIHQLRGGSVWDPINDDVRFVSTVRDTAGKMAGELIDFNIPLIDKNAGELIYGVVMSMADVLASRGISQSAGVEGISMFILGSSAASDGMYNAAASGKGETESVVQGVLSGLIESLTEQISWKSLQGLNTVGRKSLAREIARRTAFQGITEGGEEAIASLANMGISVLMYGIEDSDFGDLKKQVAFDASKNGETLTDEELTTRALLRFAQDAGADAFSGLLSGVGFGAGSLATQQGRADIVTENILAKLENESQNGAEMPVVAPAPGVSAEQQEIGNELVAIAMGVDPDLAEEIKAEFQKPMNSTQLAEASGKVSQAILRAEQGMAEPAEQQPVQPAGPAQAQEAAPYQPPVPATQIQVSTAQAYQARLDEAIARKEEAIRRRDAAVRRLGQVKQVVVQDQLAKWGQMDAEYAEMLALRQRVADLQAVQPADFNVPEVAQEVQAVEAEMDRLGIPREVVRPTDPALTEPAMQAPEQATPLEAPARPIDPALTEQGILPAQTAEAVKPLKTAPARPVDPALTERFNQLVEQRITPQIEALGKTETRTAGEERAEAAQGTFVPARVESVEIGEQTLEYRTLPVEETVYNEQREKNSDMDDGAYSLAFQTAYVAGLSGSRALLENSGVIQGLDAETAEAAYKAGQEAIKKGMALGPKAKPVPGLLAKGAGRVRMLADVAKMDAPQKKMAAALSQFSRAMGLNVEIYMSKPNADGVFTEEQGSYNPRTGVFRFDINAGINTQAQSENAVIAAMTYALPRVMGHEFTHFLKTQSPELFQKYQESLLQKLVEKDVDLDERIRSKLARSTHGALSMDVALEEVIADGSEMMLQDSTAFADVLKADQNLWQKFKKWLADFTKTMQAQLRRIGPGFAESAATMEVVNGVLKVADDLQQQYDAMLREAFKGRPAQAAPAMVEDSNADTQDAGVKFQMREPVEKTARLIAVHNLNELKLSASIESGGFPMPSIALIKEGQGHDMYGDISVVFGRETIDPQADKRNAVYSSDGWTPVHTGQQEGASLDQVLDDMLKDQLRSNVPEVIDAVEQYASVDEMKNKSSRLGKVDNYDEIKENLSKKFNDVVAAFDKSKNPFGKQNRRFFIAESLRGLLQRGATTVDDIQREMAFYDSKSTPIDASRENAQKFYDLLQEIYNIPTGYFEAKPERVVGAGEVRAAIHPNTTSKSLVDSMKRMGWRLLEYEAGNSQDRLDKLNSLEDVLFSERDSEGRQLTPEQAEFFKDSKVRDAKGNLKPMYHGTARADRVGTIFDPARATSGPMAFFTDNKSIADNYSKDKRDTSIANDERYDSYETQFRAVKGEKDVPIQRAWYLFTPTERADIERKARMLTTDDDSGEYVLKTGNKAGTGGLDFNIKDHKGNVIGALIEEWLNSGNLYNKEGDFLQVLDMTGIKDALAKHGYEAPVFLNPDARNEAVYESYLNITNPFNTANIDQAFVDDLEIALATYHWSAADIQADMWDKRNVTPEDFVQRLRKDVENNTTHAWTSIPDYVTDYLKTNGYDGILDKGGKYTDIGHTVAVPFYPSQIKRTDNLTPTSSPDIRFAERDPENALPSPRAILAGAFGNVAVTEAEKKRVEQYKRGADRYNRVEKALRGLEAERRKLHTQGGTAEQKADNRRGIEELKDQLNKADRVLLGLENSQPLRDLVAREREKAERTIREREKKRSAEYREQVRERSKAAADKRIAKDKERREQKETRAKHRQSIHKLTKELAEWIASPSGKKHVPEVLRGAIGEFLLSINEQSKRAAIGGRDTAEDRRFYDRLDALNKALQRVQKFQNDDAGQFVDDVYEGVSGFLDLPAEFTERLAEILTQVKGIIDSNPGEHVLALMDNEALAALDEAMTALNTAVGQMNALIGNRFAQTADEIGKMTMEEMKALKSRLAKKGLVHRFMNWENILPVYAFDRFGKAGKAMMQNFIDGFHKMSKNAQAIVDFSEKTFKANEARAWGKDVRTFVVDGNEIQMSAAHVMSVWALMNREQAKGHILGGGIRVSDFKVGSKNYVDSGHVLTPLDVKTMLDTLTPRQREVAKALQGFMSTTGSAWGNEVSMTRFGVKLFGEENYFPIQSVRENMDERMDGTEGNPLYRLLNLAMTKPLTKNANNQIIVGNIFDVFAAHMSDMAQYNGLALPTLNALKWYNYRESYKNRDGQKRVESVRGAIRNAHGDAGLNYIYRLMADINGSRMTGGGEAFAMNSLRRFNRAAVAANFRVMLLQPTSIIRAHNVIDARYLTGGALRNMARMRANMREMEQYSGIAAWKQMGFYDVNLSRSLQEMIKRDNSLLDRATEKTMALPQAMDRITWAAIWNGSKMQVAAQNPGMDRTSAEYFDKVRDLFDQAIYRTQVVDSMLTRSDFMRRPSGTAKAFSSFMSEPTMSYNILASQVHALNDDIASGMSMGAAWKKNGRKITRTVTTWALSAALVTMVEALSGAWRDDDEYDTFKEKFDKALRTNALDNFMPINLPIVSDLWEIAKRGARQAFNLDLRAYESNNPFLASYELVADGVNAVAGYLDGSNKKITEYGAAYAALRALSSLTGHPFSGATREVVDLWNNTVGTMYPQYRVTRYEPTKAGGINKLFQGLVDGDAERVAELRATLERQGVDDKDVNEGLRRNIRAEIDEGRVTPEEGMKRLVEWGGLVETSPTIKGWLADGLIDDEQAETLLKTYWKDDPKEIYRLMDKWENGTDTDGDGYIDYSVNDRFTQAVRTGNDLRAVIAEYLDPKKFGSTKSSLSAAITNTFKDEYVAATPAERSRLKGYLLNAYVLLGYDRYKKSKDIDAWLKK